MDLMAESIATGADPVELLPVHQSLLLKAIWRKLDNIEKQLAALTSREEEK